MKSDELLNHIGDVPEKWIKEAGEEYTNKSRRLRILTKAVTAVACLGLVIFAVSRTPWKQKPANSGSTDIATENAGEIKEYISAAVPTLSPDALHQLDELQAQQKETEKKVNAYLDQVHSNAQEMTLRMNLLPVGNRVCWFNCRSGTFYDSSQKAEALSRQLEELRGEVFLQRTEEIWYRLKDMPGLKYLILEDANGRSLWEFGGLYTPDANALQDPELVYQAEEDPFRAAYPDADYGAASYGELYQLIYSLNGPEDILQITAVAPTMTGGALAREIREKIGTQTIVNTDLIALFCEIIKDAPYNSGDSDKIDSSRFTYSFSTDARDKDASGESLWGGRYLTLTLKNGITIDSLKYSALSGTFYEHGGILPSFLTDEQVAVLNSLFEIEQDGSALDLSEKYRLSIVYNSAASRDCDRLLSYLDSHPDSELYRHFAGMYINNDQRMTVMLSCDTGACVKELEKIGFERGAEIRLGDFGSCYDTMKLLDELNRGIARINQAVLDNKATDAENELMTYLPCTHYDHLTNHIQVSVVAEDKDAADRAIALFKELVGDFPGITFATSNKEEVTGIDY